MRVRSPRNSKQQRVLRVTLAAALVIGVGMLLPRAFSFVGAAVMAPFHATNQWLNESSALVPTFFRDRQALLEENQRLRNDLVIAERSDLTQQRLFDENQRLRSLLGAADENRLAAAVIARPNQLPYDLMQIDRGAAQGVEFGAPVYVGKDVVIGLVSHVAEQYSFVQLFTSPDFEATVYVEGPNVVAVMEGVGGGVARVRLPQGIPIQVGDMVYLPTIEPGAFGRVSYVENEPTQPEQYGYVTTHLSLASVFYVAVGRTAQVTQSVDAVEENVQEYLQQSLVVPGVSIDISTTTATSTATTTEPMVPPETTPLAP